jgi:hypothetical protein
MLVSPVTPHWDRSDNAAVWKSHPSTGNNAITPPEAAAEGAG